MDQKKRNIRLLILTGFLLITVVMMSVVGNTTDDTTDIDRALFSIENTIDINRIVIENKDGSTTMEYKNGKWLLNDLFEADPSKVHLFFATIQQVSIRRPVGSDMKTGITSDLGNRGSRISLYTEEGLLMEFTSFGQEDSRNTYFGDNEENLYLMEIPGYRAYIHPLVAVNEKSWRNLNLFHRMNWSNLAGLSVMQPGKPGKSIRIVQGRQFFEVEGLSATDTTKLIDFVDYVSLLEADRYLENVDTLSGRTPDLVIDVRDVGNRPFIIELFGRINEGDEIVGRMDSSVYFALPTAKAAPLFVSRDEFRK